MMERAKAAANLHIAGVPQKGKRQDLTPELAKVTREAA